MKKYLFALIALLVEPATSMAYADKMLRNWLMLDDKGAGSMMWVFLIIVILTGCTPYY